MGSFVNQTDYIDIHIIYITDLYTFTYICLCLCKTFDYVWCKIWSWSPVPCEKHGPRDSGDKNRGRRPRFFSLLRPEGHVFHTAWETMIKSYHCTLADWFFFRVLVTQIWILVLWNRQFLSHFMVVREIALLLWTGCQWTQMNNCHENLNTCSTRLNGI